MIVKVLIIIAPILLLICSGCIDSTDGIGMVPKVFFYYINESNHDLILSATKTNDTTSFIVAHDSLLHPGDTGSFWGYSFNTANGGPFETYNLLNSVKITFLDSINFCILFSGDVTDSLLDIRVISSYELYEQKLTRERIDYYFYHIKETLFNMAVPCNN